MYLPVPSKLEGFRIFEIWPRKESPLERIRPEIWGGGALVFSGFVKSIRVRSMWRVFFGGLSKSSAGLRASVCLPRVESFSSILVFFRKYNGTPNPSQYFRTQCLLSQKGFGIAL